MPDLNKTLSVYLAISLGTLSGLVVTSQTTRAEEWNTDLFNYSLEELENIPVVTASKRIQKLAEAPATIYVITEEDIKQYGYRDLKDVLQNLPGVEYANAHSNLQGGQRGFAENWSQTKLLINGRPMNKLWSGEAYIASQYTLNNVKQIEVVQGPASALYGADAFTGVINIITKNSDNSRLGTDIASSLGSVDQTFDSKQVSFNNISRRKNLAITLSGTIFNQNGPDFTNFVRTSEYTYDNLQLRNEMLDHGNPYRDANRSYNANADFVYSIDNSASVNAGVYLLRDEDGGGMENPEISFTNFNYSSEQILTYLKYENEFDSSPVKLTVDAYREDEDDYIRFQDRDGMADSSTPYSVTNPPYLAVFNVENSKAYTFNTQFDIHPQTIPNYLIVGFGYHDVTIGNPAFTGLKPGDTTLGSSLVGRYLYPPTGYFPELKPFLNQTKTYIYLQDQHSFANDRLQITLGGRYDHHNIYGSITNIRSGIYYKLGEHWAVKALYGEAFHEPTMFDLSEGPDLVPASMKTREFSIQFNPTRNISGQMVFFQNHAYNIIETSATDQNREVNSGSKRVQGVETLIKWRLERLRGYVWYDYEHDPNDRKFIDIAKKKFGLGVVYSFTDKLSLSLQEKYTGKITSTALDQNLNLTTIRIPTFNLFNLTLLAQRIHFETFPDVDLSLSVYNLLNAKNLYPNVRGSDPSRFLDEKRSFYIRGKIYY